MILRSLDARAVRPYEDIGGLELYIAIPNDWEEKVAFILRIFVENVLHFLGPFDGQFLACLASFVGDVAISEIFLLEECHIDKTHATEHETQDEHIPCEVEMWDEPEIMVCHLLDDFQWNSPLNGLVNSSIHMAEGLSVFDNIVFDSPVVDGTQDSDIEGAGIGGYATFT